MKRGQKTRVFVVGSLVLCLGAPTIFAGAPGANPYQGIVDRNVFQLRPPPAPPTPGPPAAPPPKIALTGITTILGNKRALLKWPVPAKPGQPAKEASFILAEGQGEDDITVTEIDEVAGTVRVMNHGQPQSLNFTDDGAKLVTAPPIPIASAATANPALSPAGVPTPAGAAAPTTIRTIPQRTMRLPPAPGAQPSASAPGGVVYPSAGAAGQPQAQGPPLSVDEQTLFIEAQRLKLQQEGNPLAEALPPTPMTQRRPEGGQPQAQ